LKTESLFREAQNEIFLLTATACWGLRRFRFSPSAQKRSASELDAVTGGAGVVDTIVQAVKTVAQVVTGTTAVCTNHWYSD